MDKVVALATGGALVLSLAVVATMTTQASAAPCVPADAYTETTDWVLASPGAGWYQVDERTVVDSAAVEAVADRWENLSWFNYKGNFDGVGQPALTDSNWHAVPALPQGLPHDPVPGTVYNVSHNDVGLGAWFKYDGDFIPGTAAKAAVTHQEFKFALDHAAVTCPDIAGEEEVVPKPDKKPAKVVDEPTVKGVEAVAPEAAAPAAAAPTAVAAGIGSPASSPLALVAPMLVAGGLLLLLAGAWIGFGRRVSGAHEA